MGASATKEAEFYSDEPFLDEVTTRNEEVINIENDDSDILNDDEEEEEVIIFPTEEPVNNAVMEIPENIPKPETIKVRVDKVNFDGLIRTEDGIIKDIVNELYDVENYEDLCLKSTDVRTKLAALGCFQSIEIFIDNSRGIQATPNGVEVLYVIKELPLINYEVNAVFGQNNGTFNVVANVRNLFGRGDKINFKSTVGTIPMSNFTLSASLPYPNAAWQPTLNLHLIKETNIKHFSQRKVLLDVALKASKRMHSLQLEGGDGSFLYNVWNGTNVHPANESSKGTSIFAARHILSSGDAFDGTINAKGNISKLITEVSVMGWGVEKEAVVKNVVDVQRIFRLHTHLKLRANGQCGVLHKLPIFDRKDMIDKSLLSRASTFFWQLGLDLSTPLSVFLSGDKFKDFFNYNSLKPHIFIHTGSDGIISAEQDFPCNINNVLKNAQLAGGFGLKLRLGDLANMELNYRVPLWTRSSSEGITSPGLQFGLGWKFL